MPVKEWLTVSYRGMIEGDTTLLHALLGRMMWKQHGTQKPFWCMCMMSNYIEINGPLYWIPGACVLAIVTKLAIYPIRPCGRADPNVKKGESGAQKCINV